MQYNISYIKNMTFKSYIMILIYRCSGSGYKRHYLIEWQVPNVVIIMTTFMSIVQEAVIDNGELTHNIERQVLVLIQHYYEDANTRSY